MKEKEPSESRICKELSVLLDDKDRWEESVPYVSSLFSRDSVRIQSKALWLIGEIGLAYPMSVREIVSSVASFLDSRIPLLRERSLNALGRIERGSFDAVGAYWTDLFRFDADEEADVRLSFIWASENIASNSPGVYDGHMLVFGTLLGDADEWVRMEAPEMFRVVGKSRSDPVEPYLERLRDISETDDNRVVRIHCLGVIRAARPGSTNIFPQIIYAHKKKNRLRVRGSFTRSRDVVWCSVSLRF